MNEDNLIVTLTINGRLEQAQIIAAFADKSRNYVALAPIGGAGGDIYLYRYREIGAEGIELMEIYSDMEFDAALARFEEVIGADIGAE
jgi:hypothetical protein